MHECVICFRQRKSSNHQFMSDLPAHRITYAPPFSKVGCDYASPITLRLCRGRNPKYITSLQQRPKWKTKQESLQPGIMVLVKEPRLIPPTTVKMDSRPYCEDVSWTRWPNRSRVSMHQYGHICSSHHQAGALTKFRK